MVNFAKDLSQRENPVWRNQYLNYVELKQLLYEGIKKAPTIGTQSIGLGFLDGGFNYDGYVARFDEAFLKTILTDLDRVNSFYKEKTRYMQAKFMDLKSQVESVLKTLNKPQKNCFQKIFARRPSASEDQELKLNKEFREFYNSLFSLAMYQDLNYTGFRKIFKKHDKLFGNTVGQKTMRSIIDLAPFHVSDDIEMMIRETEHIFTTVFEKGNRAKAMKTLTIHRDDTISTWTAFKLGLMVGTFVVLFVVLAVSGILDPMKNKWRVVVRFYRGTAALTLYLCLLGVNMYVWRRRGINHVYIFELDTHDNLAHHQFWNVSAFFGVLWAISVVVFLNSENIGVPVYVSPFVLHLIVCVFLFNPFPFLYWTSRKWLIKISLRILTAPFHRVSFADFWMCDQLSSLISIVLDYQYIMCFYFTPDVFEVKGNQFLDHRVCITMEEKTCHCDSSKLYYRHLIRAIPSFLRLIQCIRRFYDYHLVFPHLVNGIKYLLSLLVVLFSTLHALEINKEHPKIYLYIWIAVSIASSLISYSWDVKMDWGLMECSEKRRFLREDLLYPTTWFYYVAIVGDFFLRFSWAVALPLIEMRFVNPDIMLTVTTPMEIFRRFVWNLFRLENEQIHINNMMQGSKLRLSQGVPSSTSDMGVEELEQLELIRVMDGPDGLTKKWNIVVPQFPSSRKGSRLSNKFLEDSKTELFTRVNSEVSQTEIKSVDNSELSDEKFEERKRSTCEKLKDSFCRCFLRKK